MNDPEDVRKVLDVGEAHIVDGVSIVIKRFQPRANITEDGDINDDVRNSDSAGSTDGGDLSVLRQSSGGVARDNPQVPDTRS